MGLVSQTAAEANHPGIAYGGSYWTGIHVTMVAVVCTTLAAAFFSGYHASWLPELNLCVHTEEERRKWQTGIPRRSLRGRDMSVCCKISWGLD